MVAEEAPRLVITVAHMHGGQADGRECPYDNRHVAHPAAPHGRLGHAARREQHAGQHSPQGQEHCGQHAADDEPVAHAVGGALGGCRITEHHGTELELPELIHDRVGHDDGGHTEACHCIIRGKQRAQGQARMPRARKREHRRRQQEQGCHSHVLREQARMAGPEDVRQRECLDVPVVDDEAYPACQEHQQEVAEEDFQEVKMLSHQIECSR